MSNSARENAMILSKDYFRRLVLNVDLHIASTRKTLDAFDIRRVQNKNHHNSTESRVWYESET